MAGKQSNKGTRLNGTELKEKVMKCPVHGSTYNVDCDDCNELAEIEKDRRNEIEDRNYEDSSRVTTQVDF